MRRSGVLARLGAQMAGQGTCTLSKAPAFLPDLALASGDALLAPAASALAFRRQPTLRATFASSPMYQGPIGSNMGGNEGMGAGMENPAVTGEEFAKAATRQHMSTDAVGPVRGAASEQIKMTDGEAVKRAALPGLCLTVALGMVFTMCQAFEYYEAALSLSDGYYGSAFYTATGFHGLHVIIGTIFLLVCAIRMARGQFAPTHHLGFQLAAWYWHFVDVVWLFVLITFYDF